MSKPTILVSAAALIDRDGRILLARRPDGKHLAGTWEFPGGKIEAGESPETALIRELDEELGISTHKSCLSPIAFASHDYDRFHLILMLFACRKWQGQPEGREGQALQWARPATMFGIDMPPADRPLIGLLDALV
jgi:8-oxo-dGTP diphosphatase